MTDNAKPDVGYMRRFLLSLTLVAAFAAPARADVIGQVGQHLEKVGSQIGQAGSALWGLLDSSSPETGAAIRPVEVTPSVRIAHAIAEMPTDKPQVTAADFGVPSAPAVSEPPKPSWEKGSKFLYCVEYARQLSGLSIFGDAKHWWERAKNLYARVTHPAEESVMVFSGSSRLKRGHLAVVSHVVSNREIRVEQANWLNRGEIDRATPVLDVSEKNDWSKVRVWDMPSGQYGSRVYAISGFILKPSVRLARAD